MSPIDNCMWLLSSTDPEHIDYREVRTIVSWFKEHTDEVLLKQNNSYYPRLKDTKKRGFNAVKEMAEKICLDDGTSVRCGMILNLIPLLKNDYTICPEGIITYSPASTEHMFSEHECITIKPYNPVVVPEVKSDFMSLFKELIDIENENLDKQDIKDLIAYLMEQL
tara:strand:- start:826 stop:1323 length:498 start_codon:yes stop_codon:yes gene_type:complete